jgi:hypothetical protein
VCLVYWSWCFLKWHLGLFLLFFYMHSIKIGFLTVFVQCSIRTLNMMVILLSNVVCFVLHLLSGSMCVFFSHYQHKVQFFSDLAHVFVENYDVIFNVCCGVWFFCYFPFLSNMFDFIVTFLFLVICLVCFIILISECFLIWIGDVQFFCQKPLFRIHSVPLFYSWLSSDSSSTFLILF